MSDRKHWKMLHLLYNLPPGTTGLSDQQLADAGVDCDPDTIQPLINGGAVEMDYAGLYSLSEPAMKILTCSVVANRRWPADDMRVDRPTVFVVIPFSEPWSDDVYGTIKKAVESKDVGFKCFRGDEPPRVGDLTQTIWNELMGVGLVIADVSAPNPNVFYEIGLTHALGKDVFILKQSCVKIPADFGGAHYYEYDLGDLDAARQMLVDKLMAWSVENKVAGVRAVPGHA